MTYVLPTHNSPRDDELEDRVNLALAAVARLECKFDLNLHGLECQFIHPALCEAGLPQLTRMVSSHVNIIRDGWVMNSHKPSDEDYDNLQSLLNVVYPLVGPNPLMSREEFLEFALRLAKLWAHKAKP